MKKLVTVFVLSLMLIPQRADAGARDLRVLFVNMTPGTTTDASRQCVSQIRRFFTCEEGSSGCAPELFDTTEIVTRGESAIRRVIGRPSPGDGSRDYLTWDRAMFSTVMGDGQFDTVLLVDCRPELMELDLVVIPAGDTGRFRLRHLPLTPARTLWPARLAAPHAWVGFVP